MADVKLSDRLFIDSRVNTISFSGSIGGFEVDSVRRSPENA